ncbi:TPA: restriction endonuclease subunit S [Legionella pneumophila]
MRTKAASIAAWKKIRLKRAVTINNGKDYKSVESVDGYPVFGSGGVFAYSSEFLYNGEAILLGRKGTVDKPLYVNGAFWTVDTMFYAIPLRGYHAKFIFYCSQTIPFDQYQSDTAIPSMTQSVLNNHEFLVPDYKLQKEIADFLDRETARIDQLIEKKKKLVSMLKERFDSQINEVMSQFTPRKLKMIASARLSNVDKHIYKDEIAVNVVHYTDVYYNDVITKNTTLPKGSVTAFEKQKFSLKGGEVLVTKDSETPDDIAIPVYIDGVKENTVCGYHLAIIKPNTTLLDGRFIFWGLKTKRVRDYFSLAAQGVTRFGIPIGKISDCPLPYTSNLEIQKKIAHELFVKNEMKLQLNRAIKRSIDRLKQLRASLITEAVTGQLDIELWKKRGSTDERLDNIEESMQT